MVPMMMREHKDVTFGEFAIVSSRYGIDMDCLSSELEHKAAMNDWDYFEVPQ
jgi:hypothetical protein